MPRIIPRLARLSLTAPALPRTIGLSQRIFPLPTQTIPQSLTSSRFYQQPSTPASAFTFTSSPRSSILSRLSPLSFLPQQTQIRTLAYGTTYQPSQRKRKRKYGFLARLKGGRLGQAILARRRMRGRRFLSH